jgi:hypothetical protein
MKEERARVSNVRNNSKSERKEPLDFYLWVLAIKVFMLIELARGPCGRAMSLFLGQKVTQTQYL